MTEALARLANEHWLAAYRGLIRDLKGVWRDFGAVHAYVGGLPLGFSNGVLVLDEADAEDLRAAIAWVAASGLPYRVRLDRTIAADLLDVPLRLSLARDTPDMPGMVLAPIPAAPAPAPGVTTTRIDETGYDEFAQLLIDTGLPAAWARQVFPAELAADADNALFTARLDGRPAATAVAVRTGNTAGIYAVGTVEPARRRGVGTAVTWAAIEAGRQWGCRAAVLQASEMGYPIYRSMGFEHVVDYARFGPVGQGPG